jgi:hypothetical protein
MWSMEDSSDFGASGIRISTKDIKFDINKGPIKCCFFGFSVLYL